MARISPDSQASELAARRYNAGQSFEYYEHCGELDAIALRLGRRIGRRRDRDQYSERALVDQPQPHLPRIMLSCEPSTGTALVRRRAEFVQKAIAENEDLQALYSIKTARLSPAIPRGPRSPKGRVSCH